MWRSIPKIPAQRPDKKRRGIYQKFNVSRTDGQSSPGKKHDGCVYFVLDIDHDPHARPAMVAYARSCAAEYPELAKDIQKMLDRVPLRRS